MRESEPSRRSFLKSGISAFLALPAFAGQKEGHEAIPIVVGNQASPVELVAAQELSKHLHSAYSSNLFPIVKVLPERGPRILLGTFQSQTELRKYVPQDRLRLPESFVVSADISSADHAGVIAGSDARATLFAVYALLEELGFGFYLSYNAKPLHPEESIQFAHWHLSDHPVVADRIVLNWANFLSSCSTWELADWESWITQLSRMRFNGVMVHAYGNNPMFTFSHNGQTKPVGHLTTSIKGRDWGTEHVNDVQRIYGGGKLFHGPVFGSSAALVPDDQRVQSAVSLMKKVFAFAKTRGVGITFALDVDTKTSNPQNIISTLPETARFDVRGFHLANPDTPEGFEYYKSQVSALLNAYPEITRIAIWVRGGRTKSSLWRSLEPKDFPRAWIAEYQDTLQKKEPAVRTDPDTPSMFAINKIVVAFRKALGELGMQHVELAIGSWMFTWLRAADAFLSSDVTLIPLDYFIAIGTEEVQSAIRGVSNRRKVLPIVWAQNDDRSFVGRPYTPFADFTSLLNGTGSAGYGIIHWTTRPLDLYFKSLSAQVWNQSKDQALEVTCGRMAERTFGETARVPGKEYLLRWIHDAPMFGRETTDRFMDRPLFEPERVITQCRGRLKILAEINKQPLSQAASEQLHYFQDHERFIIAFYQSQAAWERSVNLLKRRDIESSRKALTQCDPKAVLEQYAKAAAWGVPTRGEMGLLISMNLRWLPWVVSQRQALSMTPIRYNFEPTQRKTLAQSPGSYTFYFGRDGEIWKAQGGKESHYSTFNLKSRVVADRKALREICETGLESDRPITLRFGTIGQQHLLPGDYQVTLFFVYPHFGAPDGSVFNLSLSGSKKGKTVQVKDRIDLVRRAGGKDRPLQLSYPLTLDHGFLSVQMESITGALYFCGLMIEPETAAHAAG